MRDALKIPTEIAIRPAQGNDQGYVCSSWTRSIMDGDAIHKDGAFHFFNKVVNQLLDDSATRLLVACDPEDIRHIIGWIAYSIVPGARTLMYINVRHQNRRGGVATKLVESAGLAHNGTPINYLFDGPSAKWLMAKYPNARYINPADYLR